MSIAELPGKLYICATFQRLTGQYAVTYTAVNVSAGLYAASELSMTKLPSILATNNSANLSVSLWLLFGGKVDLQSIIHQEHSFAAINPSRNRYARILMKSEQQVEIQGSTLADCWPFLKTVTDELARQNISTSLETVNSLPLSDYQKVVDQHFESRELLIAKQNQVDKLAEIFFQCQTALLTKYQQKNPANMEYLEIVFDKVYSRLINAINDWDLAKNNYLENCADLSRSTLVLITLVKYQANLGDLAFETIQSCLCPFNIESFELGEGGWEEIVDVSICQLLRTVYAKSEKDKNVSLPTLEHMTDIGKFKKHLVLLIERIISNR